MTSRVAPRAAPASASFVELFTPKLITILREGYGPARLRADAIAGLTVAVVALPLSMAIAIASGATPAQGLYTAIIGGFIVSAFGGSRFQIGGPAGAFIVLVAATVHAHGMEGLFLATILSGLFLLVTGLLRLGVYIKFVPYPVTVGFTAGIAVVILSSQLREMLGLTLAVPEPGPLIEKLPVLWQALPGIDPATALLSLGTIALIAGIRKLRPQLPALLIAVASGAALVLVFDLPVATIGSKFGGIPAGLPVFSLPQMSLSRIVEVLPSAVAFTLLGSIESLLSAVVADSMTGRRHRSNCELVAQGLANIASGLFGGICVTGTIARTATNVRAGAHGPVAGMLHALFLLAFILIAAPLAGFVPLASLAGVLAVVAWNMVERHAIAGLLRLAGGDAVVLSATFLLTVFRDLTEAIIVGVALGSLLFIHRMSKTTAIESQPPIVVDDRADDHGSRRIYEARGASNPEVVIYRISGAFFFGAAASVGLVLDRIPDTHKMLIIDFQAVPFIDSTAANTIGALVRKGARRGVKVVLAGTSRDMRRELFAQGVKPPLVGYSRGVAEAMLHLGDRKRRQGAA